MATKKVKEPAKWAKKNFHSAYFSSCPDLEEDKESFEKFKRGLFKMFDFCLTFFLKSFNETLSES